MATPAGAAAAASAPRDDDGTASAPSPAVGTLAVCSLLKQQQQQQREGSPHAAGCWRHACACAPGAGWGSLQRPLLLQYVPRPPSDRDVSPGGGGAEGCAEAPSRSAATVPGEDAEAAAAATAAMWARHVWHLPPSLAPRMSRLQQPRPAAWPLTPHAKSPGGAPRPASAAPPQPTGTWAAGQPPPLPPPATPIPVPGSGTASGTPASADVGQGRLGPSPALLPPPGGSADDHHQAALPATWESYCSRLVGGWRLAGDAAGVHASQLGWFFIAREMDWTDARLADWRGAGLGSLCLLGSGRACMCARVRACRAGCVTGPGEGDRQGCCLAAAVILLSGTHVHFFGGGGVPPLVVAVAVIALPSASAWVRGRCVAGRPLPAPCASCLPAVGGLSFGV